MSKDQIEEDSFTSDEDFESEADSESSEDVDLKVAEEEIFDTEFLKCYAALKKKDAKIYNKDTRFFSEDLSDEEKQDDKSPEERESTIELDSKQRARPKMTLLDHQLAHIDSYNTDDPPAQEQPVQKSHYEKELDEIRNDIKKISENVDSDSDDELFISAKTSKVGPEKPKKKISAMLDNIVSEEDEDLSHLKQFWNHNEQLSEDDKFLRDYILNKRYLSKPGEQPKKPKESFFSENIDQLSDVEEDEDTESAEKKESTTELSTRKFEKIARIPRNSTTTIRDLVEKREKKEKRTKKLSMKKMKKKALQNEDCEDIIDDLKTRFHYAETEPTDYGLSPQELLMGTEEEIDKWISVYQKGNLQDVDEMKKKIFASIYGDDEEPEEEVTKKRKKKRKRGTKTGVAPDRLLSYGLDKTQLKRSKLLF